MNCLNYSDSEEESEVHVNSQDQARSTAAVPATALKRPLDQAEDAEASRGSSVNSFKKKKLLPKLALAFQTAPIDDPTQHQGRVRARPWVQGEYPAHIYLELKLSKRLREKLGEIVDRVQSWLDEIRLGLESQEGDHTQNQTVHPLFAREPSVKPNVDLTNTDNAKLSARSTASSPTLHVSLSHPLPLRAFQIPLLLDHMRQSTGRTAALRIGLEGGFRAYTNGVQSENGEQVNDEIIELEDKSAAGKNPLDDLGRSGMGKKSRGFLALRVGAGHDMLLKIQTETIDRFLQIHHLPRYHRSPEFHTSFAWILLSGTGSNPFDETFLTRLEAEYGKSLREEMKSGWEVTHIKVRVGKVVHSFGV